MALPRNTGRPIGRNGLPRNPAEGFSELMGFSRSIFSGAQAVGEKVQAAGQYRKETQFGNLAGMMGSLDKMASQIGTASAKAIERALSQAKSSIAQGGGANIQGAQLASILSNLTSAIRNEVGNLRAQGNNVGANALTDAMGLFQRGAQGVMAKGDITGLKSIEKEMTQHAFKTEGVTNAERQMNAFTAAMGNVTDAIQDSNLKQELSDISSRMQNAAEAAQTVEQQFHAVSYATEEVKRLAERAGRGSGAGSADASQLKNLAGAMDKSSKNMEKDIKIRQKGIPFQQRMLKFLSGGIGGIKAAGGPWLAAASRIWDAGKQIHAFVEGQTKIQNQITKERAQFGRYLMGTTIAHGDLMGAVGTGRRAGVSDTEVVQMLGNMGKGLAAARWGEGGLIEKIGRWGGTVWNPEGTMMNAHQMYRQMSQIMNALPDKEEQLQFLYDQGLGPEKYMFIKNYERDAARNERSRRNARYRGTLEDAAIFDESGMSARIDAFAEIEKKRRNIRIQNAYEQQGIIAGVLQQWNPENWLFPEYSARQQGIKEAKSEIAMEKLTTALKKLTDEITSSGGGDGRGKGGGGAEVPQAFKSLTSNMSLADFEALSFHSGASEAERKNLRGKSDENALAESFAATGDWDKIRREFAAAGSAEHIERLRQKYGVLLSDDQATAGNFTKEGLEGARRAYLLAEASRLAGAEVDTTANLDEQYYRELASGSFKKGSHEDIQAQVRSLARSVNPSIGAQNVLDSFVKEAEAKAQANIGTSMFGVASYAQSAVYEQMKKSEQAEMERLRADPTKAFESLVTGSDEDDIKARARILRRKSYDETGERISWEEAQRQAKEQLLNERIAERMNLEQLEAARASQEQDKASIFDENGNVIEGKEKEAETWKTRQAILGRIEEAHKEKALAELAKRKEAAEKEGDKAALAQIEEEASRIKEEGILANEAAKANAQQEEDNRAVIEEAGEYKDLWGKEADVVEEPSEYDGTVRHDYVGGVPAEDYRNDMALGIASVKRAEALSKQMETNATKAEQATSAMETNATQTEAAAESGNALVQQPAEAKADEGTAEPQQNNVHVETTINVEVKGNGDPQQIAEAIEGGPIKTIIAAVLANTPTSDGNG